MTRPFTIFGYVLVLIADCISAPNGLPIPTRVRDMEKNPELFEGDIILPPGGIGEFLKNGMVGDEYRWPNATVVYEIDPKFSEASFEDLLDGWETIRRKTCIKFRHRTAKDEDYVFVTKGAVGSGCSASVGRIGGRQAMNLAPSCVSSQGVIVHEMLHTIGFYHEQSRPDRDDSVTIVWDKIEPGREHNFNKYEWTEAVTFGAPYDYDSVLHYAEAAFSVDGSPTIIPNVPGVSIGQRIGISELDALKANLMYKC